MTWRCALLDLVPDLPRWVEARASLLHGVCEAFWVETTPALSTVYRDHDADYVFVVGAPSAAAIQAAVRDRDVELIAAPESADLVAAALPNWHGAPATIFSLGDASRLASPEDGRVDWLSPNLLGLCALADDLREELEDAAEHVPIAASFADGAPVAFCYAGSVTETLWDISIDTLPEHRLRGHAGRAVSFLIRHMATLGRQPVWGALDDNPASYRLAEKLGFIPVDRLVVFTPPHSPGTV